jgi:UTP--glucose-1-phosphate uridylyltransferase
VCSSDLYLVEDIIEKPGISEAPSNIGTVGRYVFAPEIFECLRKTMPGIGNEVQLTDAIKLLMGYQKVYAYLFWGRRYDTGDKAGYVRAIMDFAMEEEKLRDDIIDHFDYLFTAKGKNDVTATTKPQSSQSPHKV